MPEMSGTTGNVLWLRKSSDFSIVNTGGDALTESSTSGWFTATVTESWTEQLSATIVDSGGLIPRAGWLPVGGDTVVEGTAVLDSASVSAIRDGIPKVGETHRYTQVDSGATTTDVSIGEAT